MYQEEEKKGKHQRQPHDLKEKRWPLIEMCVMSWNPCSHDMSNTIAFGLCKHFYKWFFLLWYCSCAWYFGLSWKRLDVFGTNLLFQHPFLLARMSLIGVEIVRCKTGRYATKARFHQDVMNNEMSKNELYIYTYQSINWTTIPRCGFIAYIALGDIGLALDALYNAV